MEDPVTLKPPQDLVGHAAVPVPGAPRKPFDFEEQLRVGAKGESFILGAHPELRWPAKGERRWDLEGGNPDGTRRTVEVKTDTYPHSETPNYFWERRTNIRRGASGVSIDGGPWRSARDGVSELVYLFTNGGTKAEPGDPVGYWFRDLPALVLRIEMLINAGIAMPRRVRSLDVSAFGYAVPRGEFGDLCECVVYKDGVEGP